MTTSTETGSSSSVFAQIIEGSSSLCPNLDAIRKKYPEFVPGMGLELVDDSSDQFSISYSRKFPKHIGENLEKALPMVKSAVASYGISCELNMDNWYGELIFTTSRNNSQDTIDRARVALVLLQMNTPPRMALKVFSGSHSAIIKTGFQQTGLSTMFKVKKTQFEQGMKRLKQCIQELERLTCCEVYISDNFVIPVGPFQGVKIVKKIVKDSIAHNVPPATHLRTLMRDLARRDLEALRL